MGISEALPIVMVAKLVCSGSKRESILWWGSWSEMNPSIHIWYHMHVESVLSTLHNCCIYIGCCWCVIGWDDVAYVVNDNWDVVLYDVEDNGDVVVYDVDYDLGVTMWYIVEHDCVDVVLYSSFYIVYYWNEFSPLLFECCLYMGIIQILNSSIAEVSGR